jgi:citrate lyase subunit beta/citryl-CoA lyase
MRSLLFVPADSEKKLEKGLGSEADCLLIDLEDSVALPAKPQAREIALAYLRDARLRETRPQLYVRVNALDSGLTEADLEIVMQGAPDGILLPKSLSGAHVQQLGGKLAVKEAENNLYDGSTKIIAFATETAGSIFKLGSFAGSSPRLAGLTWGAEDLATDLGVESNRLPDGSYTYPFALARSLTLFAAHAAEVLAIETVYANFRDLEGFRFDCEAGRRDGFVARMAIHPNQVAIINEVFTPSPEAIARAEAIVAAFAADPDAGVTSLDGQMLDRPHLAKARKLLARAPRR